VINGMPPFEYFWADGDPDSLSPSYLYFGDLQGNKWQLPYTMADDEQIPLKLTD